MDAERVESILDGCERALVNGGPVDLKALGFWQAVAAVKRHPEWVEYYADRIGAIDRRAFERAVWPTIAPPFGVAALAIGSLAGVLLVASTYVAPRFLKGLVLLAGAGALLGTTHDLAHFVVGKAVGLRFSHMFVDGPTGIQPGLKIDYASYLRTPPQARAWMHAAGAIVTKIVPFAILAATARAKIPKWARAALLGIGIVQIFTDLLFSTRQSDWKRFLRERRLAREAD